MAKGLEGVVRPVIFPDIRPRPRPALPPQDDPTKGFAVIQGNPAGSTSNSYSFSVNASYTRPKETERRVDVVRVSQKGGGGGDGDGGGESFALRASNRSVGVSARAGDSGDDNFVDIQVANKITMEEPGAGGKPSSRPFFYQRVQEQDNIEILRRDVIVKA